MTNGSRSLDLHRTQVSLLERINATVKTADRARPADQPVGAVLRVGVRYVAPAASAIAGMARDPANSYTALETWATSSAEARVGLLLD